MTPNRIPPLTKTSTVNKQTVNLSPQLKLVEVEMALVEALLRSNLIDENAYIEKLLEQIFISGGKRIRPLLALLVSKACFNSDFYFSRNHIIHASLAELIHTASLVHDDVIDNADLRRGKTTLNHAKSDKLAVLMGDLLFAQASVCLSRLMYPEIVGIYGQVLGDLCSGEIKQMLSAFNTDITLDLYIDKTIGKTASLFSAATTGGAIINQVSNHILVNLKQFGLNLGICFQIVDDLLDLIGNAKDLGKPLGNDLLNGVITAPAIFVLNQKDDTAQTLKALIENQSVTELANLEKARQIILNTDAINKTIKLADKYAKLSLANLDVLPDSQYKEALKQIVNQILSQVD